MTRAGKPASILTLTIDAQEMKVHYWPDYCGGIAPYALIEFRSPHEPARRIPVSETGYRSYFAPQEDVEAAPTVLEYIRDVALEMIAADSRCVTVDSNQLDLF